MLDLFYVLRRREWVYKPTGVVYELFVPQPRAYACLLVNERRCEKSL